MDIDSGTESDGKTALKEVEEREQPKAARRGPGNASMQHFHEPVPITDRSGQKRWEFKCKFCPWCVIMVHARQLHGLTQAQTVLAAS
jgi:hypothetical protein